MSRLNGKPQPDRLGYSNQRREPWIPFGRERAVETLTPNAGRFRNFGQPASRLSDASQGDQQNLRIIPFLERRTEILYGELRTIMVTGPSW